MFTTKVLTGGHTKFKMMNPSFEEIDLLVASLGALSKLTTTGKYTSLYIEYGMSEGKLLEWQLEVTFNKINTVKDTCRLFSEWRSWQTV
jgi:hypothetical protein